MDGMCAASTDWYRFVIPAFGTAVSAFIILVKLNAQTPASFLRCTSALSGALSVWHRLATPVIHLTRWSQTAAVMLIGNSYVFLHCWMASVFQFGVMFSTVFQALSNLCLRLLHAPCNVNLRPLSMALARPGNAILKHCTNTHAGLLSSLTEGLDNDKILKSSLTSLFTKYFFVGCVRAPISEELLFRGLIQTSLKRAQAALKFDIDIDSKQSRNA